ncbi:MAG: hypothetical protein OEZ10_10810 [Gammaproteobacteria bacterium]|nr:hypothetical protein [Gammaproteobacteria bacterium]
MTRKQFNAFIVTALLGVLSQLVPAVSWAGAGIAATLHNLSVSGPGAIKSNKVTQVCVFCHTPHKSQGMVNGAPLWNHTLTTGQTYTVYGSSTLDAAPGQPTGKSILCLSCHDGTVAMGALTNPPKGGLDAVMSRPMPARARGHVPPVVRGHIGTDLSDDHPISFAYDSTLAINDGQLHDPSLIAPLLLEDGEVQCTTCHDPHERDIKPFLRVTSLNGQICTTCHNNSGWIGSAHQTSTATWNGAGISPWINRRPEWVGANVGENSCFNCHAPHNAGTPVRLQTASEEETCFNCHNGNTAATNIQAEFAKLSTHPVLTTPNPNHDAASVEDPLTMSPHAECADCHNPHTVTSAPPMISFNPNNPAQVTTTPPLANALIQGVKGLDINGNVINSVTNQYELCFKCHGVPGKGACGSPIATERCGTATGYQMTRADQIYNIRDKLNPNNPALVSYHPVVANNPANNGDVVTLSGGGLTVPLDNTNSLIYCTDCHNSDTSDAAAGPGGGTGPNGPHGSNHEMVLSDKYSMDPTLATGTADAALCLKCHSEASLLTNPSGFSHQLHIEDRKNACVTCHDPHGSTVFPRLLNFLTYSNVGGRVVQILPKNFAIPTWIDKGVNSGECWLSCHNSDHSGRGY